MINRVKGHCPACGRLLYLNSRDLIPRHHILKADAGLVFSGACAGGKDYPAERPLESIPRASWTWGKKWRKDAYACEVEARKLSNGESAFYTSDPVEFKRHIWTLRAEAKELRAWAKRMEKLADEFCPEI